MFIEYLDQVFRIVPLGSVVILLFFVDKMSLMAITRDINTLSKMTLAGKYFDFTSSEKQNLFLYWLISFGILIALLNDVAILYMCLGWYVATITSNVVFKAQLFGTDDMDISPVPVSATARSHVVKSSGTQPEGLKDQIRILNRETRDPLIVRIRARIMQRFEKVED